MYILAWLGCRFWQQQFYFILAILLHSRTFTRFVFLEQSKTGQGDKRGNFNGIETLANRIAFLLWKRASTSKELLLPTSTTKELLLQERTSTGKKHLTMNQLLQWMCAPTTDVILERMQLTVTTNELIQQIILYSGWAPTVNFPNILYSDRNKTQLIKVCQEQNNTSNAIWCLFYCWTNGSIGNSHSFVMERAFVDVKHQTKEQNVHWSHKSKLKCKISLFLLHYCIDEIARNLEIAQQIWPKKKCWFFLVRHCSNLTKSQYKLYYRILRFKVHLDEQITTIRWTNTLLNNITV